MMDRIICPFCSGVALLTYEENRIYQLKCNDCKNTILHEDVSLDDAKYFFKRMEVTEGVLQAIKKQMPRKPIEEETTGFKVCPYCEIPIDEYSTNYCSNCGQKLDWSGENT